MPSLSKKAISLFLRNSCERQFVFSLYDDVERKTHGLPPRQKSRSGLGIVGQIGYQWQDAKVNELANVFGQENVLVSSSYKGKRPDALDLLQVLPTARPYQFIVEGKYDPNTAAFRKATGYDALKDAFGNDISLKNLQPDIVQILPPNYRGSQTSLKPNPYQLGLQPDGDTFVLADNDGRLRLRVIDIKLASEPGAHYFAEVVFYSMTLASWLIEHELDQEFVVIASPAVWPGSHDASNLSKRLLQWRKESYFPTAEEIAIALEEDIEIAAVDVFAVRLRRFLTDEFPSLISKDWRILSWHVDRRCKGCEYLGYPWKDENGELDQDPMHCLPMARDLSHLSQVFELSRGASEELRNKKVSDIQILAGTTSSSYIFNDHQGLRSKRTTYPHRAISLQQNITSVVPASGGDALMPRWPDLHIYIFIDYDLNTAFTAAFAIRAFWLEPVPFGQNPSDRRKKRWPENQNEDQVFLVDQPTLEREREEFIKFLRQLKKILSSIIQQDNLDTLDGRRNPRTVYSTYQLYLWDEAQRKHLIRLISRHLAYILSDSQIKDLAWLFPPPELMQKPQDATRQSPLSIVANVVFNTIALPVPHYYRLTDVVETFRPNMDGTSAPSIHPLYQEPMSDLIPAERIHEWWNRVGKWDEKQDLIKETCRKKAYSLNLVVARLERELSGVLSMQSAPQLGRPPKNSTGLAPQSQLWLEFSRLNIALQGLDTQITRAMPPHEREARLKSARLVKRLSGDELTIALHNLNRYTKKLLKASSDLFVYKMADGSREVNVRPGDFLYALSPESIHGFLDQSPYPYIKGTTLEKTSFAKTVEDSGMTAVTIEAIDRSNGLIALRAGSQCQITKLEKETNLRFSENVILDPTHKDFLTKKLELNLQAIGNPPTSLSDKKILTALGLSASTPNGSSPITPAAEFLWEPVKLSAQKVDRDILNLQNALDAYFSRNSATLDESQWKAWKQALSQRLTLIWGPPGTGKSRTLRAIIQGAVLDAIQQSKPLRLLITAFTYNAADNVLLDLEDELRSLLGSQINMLQIYRIQSKWQTTDPDFDTQHPGITNLILNRAHPSDDVKILRNVLEKPSGIQIVSCLPQQLFNLAVAGNAKPNPKQLIRNWFDFVVLDEASQMDIAVSTLVLTKLSPDSSLVLAGDDLQLPPIQQADPPQDLDFVVGSSYNYFHNTMGVIPASLDINYRSNKAIVDFTKRAGYSSKLRSLSPNLNLHYVSDFSDSKPKDWPSELFWTNQWFKFLDSAYSTLCFIYDDKISSQVNDFEADSVASLIWLFYRHLGNKLVNQCRLDGLVDTVTPIAGYSAKDFWDTAVGVVTPHRAQMSKIVSRLQEVFKSHEPDSIRSAVDTVERFQGQQRSIILASFGLGDSDIITQEDEFLFSLNRFNVLVSRARAKAIVFVTRSLIDHLSDDVTVLYESRLLKQFAESFCGNPVSIELGFLRNGYQARHGVLRRA